eukprot:scaffold387_cov244-Pinguiococcus_pyrenoidosus.AAC.21
MRLAEPPDSGPGVEAVLFASSEGPQGRVLPLHLLLGFLLKRCKVPPVLLSPVAPPASTLAILFARRPSQEVELGDVEVLGNAIRPGDFPVLGREPGFQVVLLGPATRVAKKAVLASTAGAKELRSYLPQRLSLRLGGGHGREYRPCLSGGETAPQAQGDPCERSTARGRSSQATGLWLICRPVARSESGRASAFVQR